VVVLVGILAFVFLLAILAVLLLVWILADVVVLLVSSLAVCGVVG
jgi:hypothetical protein